jgi:hypothetical protein
MQLATSSHAALCIEPGNGSTQANHALMRFDLHAVLVLVSRLPLLAK